MTASLLDVNVLVALFDPDHRFHVTVRSWLAAHRADRWASCAITQNGVIRVLSQPKYERPVSVAYAGGAVSTMAAASGHEFWDCSVGVADPTVFDLASLVGPKQLTDVYLLGLAVSRGGRLVTLDRHIPLAAVRGAREDHLVVL